MKKYRHMKSIFAALFITLFVYKAVGAKVQFNAFESGSYQQILDSNARQSFLMVAWSLECGACLSELKLISEKLHQYPAARVIFLSTDGQSVQEEAAKWLTDNGLGKYRHWIFTDTPEAVLADKLRYQIDPYWYGELPKAYLHLVDKDRQVISGIIPQRVMLSLFETLNTNK